MKSSLQIFFGLIVQHSPITEMYSQLTCYFPIHLSPTWDYVSYFGIMSINLEELSSISPTHWICGCSEITLSTKLAHNIRGDLIDSLHLDVLQKH